MHVAHTWRFGDFDDFDWKWNCTERKTFYRTIHTIPVSCTIPRKLLSGVNNRILVFLLKSIRFGVQIAKALPVLSWLHWLHRQKYGYPLVVKADRRFGDKSRVRIKPIEYRSKEYFRVSGCIFDHNWSIVHVLAYYPKNVLNIPLTFVLAIQHVLKTSIWMVVEKQKKNYYLFFW